MPRSIRREGDPLLEAAAPITNMPCRGRHNDYTSAIADADPRAFRVTRVEVSQPTTAPSVPR